jgi:hypothetical protein
MAAIPPPLAASAPAPESFNNLRRLMRGMIDPPKLKLTFFFCPKAYDRGEGLSMGLTASQGHEPVRRTICAGLRYWR